jgi:hypothetical protein
LFLCCVLLLCPLLFQSHLLLPPLLASNKKARRHYAKSETNTVSRLCVILQPIYPGFLIQERSGFDRHTQTQTQTHADKNYYHIILLLLATVCTTTTTYIHTTKQSTYFLYYFTGVQASSLVLSYQSRVKSTPLYSGHSLQDLQPCL